MAKTLFERQMIFRAKRKAKGGKRLDMWLPDEVAYLLEKLITLTKFETGPQAVVATLKFFALLKLEQAANDGNAQAQFEYAIACLRDSDDEDARSMAIRWFSESAKQGYRVSAAYNNRVHHDLGYTVPFTKGGTGYVAVSGSLNLYYRRVSFDELDRRRVYSAGTPFRGSILGLHG
jgi:hypothetical protein